MHSLASLYHLALPLLLVVVAVSVCLVRDLFSAVILMGIFSMLSVALFVSMQALDVALTEAVAGAGVATVLFLCCLARTLGKEAYHDSGDRHDGLAIMACALCALVVCYGATDIPDFGSAAAYVHTHVNPHYLESTTEQMGIINVVTAVLASWRGYDTLGELVVIFAAGAGCLTILGAAKGAAPEAERET